MEKQVIKIIRTGEDAVVLIPNGSPRDISLIPCTLAAFDKEFKDNINFFVVDLHHFHELPPSFIVLLLELSARARRRGGEMFLINLTSSARKNLAEFRPLNYLQLSENKEGVLAKIERRKSIGIKPTPAERSPSPPTVPPTRVQERYIEIPSKVDALYRACDFATSIAKSIGFDETEVNKIKIAVYEACLNAIEHAYHSDPTRTVKVQIEYSSQKMIIYVIDNGEGFKVRDEDTFDVLAAALNRKTGGMGLHIIRRSMDDVRYESNQHNGNMLILTKFL